MICARRGFVNPRALLFSCPSNLRHHRLSMPMWPRTSRHRWLRSCCGMVVESGAGVGLATTIRRRRSGAVDPVGRVGRGGMIGPGTGVRVCPACGTTDMRKGIEGSAAMARDVLRQKAAGGAVFAFRGKRGDRLELLHRDGQGFCLCCKVLERGRFSWPAARDGAAGSTSAQLSMLWEGIDRRRPDRAAPPARAGWMRHCFCLFSWCSCRACGLNCHVRFARNPA